ncbi:hypothetical protein CTAYLR_009849 [Chrysophaeum taylorii]|uniref:SET domain-containing protein n=1 Tax=Chrysophaeum taylorii TaxID=2483200 RepID=A0AAD7U607_9STRA|nr:hypothetical protein CTAYLR_009849 [Chrysophaeum taylorii]
MTTSIWKKVVVVVAGVEAFVLRESSSSGGGVTSRMSEDSWSAELRQASGGFETEEARAFMRRQAKGDASVRATNERLIEWLQSKGVWLSELSGWNEPPHSLALATSTFDDVEGEDAGRGLLARRAVVQDMELVRMPRYLCMTKDAALESPTLKGLVNVSTNEYVAIALLLISEAEKGILSSFWGPYIAVLPTTEEISPTFSWDESDLADLEGSPCLAATRSMRAKLRAEHAEFSHHCSFDQWEWAFSILFSRAIRLTGPTKEILALVPYVDFINHSPFSSSYVTLAEAPEPLFFWDDKPDDEIVVYADRSYRKFEQVFISYGPKSNSDLLLLYGFALDRNPFNSVAVQFGAATDDPLYDEKLAFAISAGRSPNETFPIYADRFADEMLQYLRMSCVTPSQLKGRHVRDLDYSTIVSVDNELAVLDTLAQACEAAIERYPPPPPPVPNPRDRNIFLTRKQRMAQRLVASERRILQRTIDAAIRKSNELEATRALAA